LWARTGADEIGEQFGLFWCEREVFHHAMSIAQLVEDL
jgi:hypothetical protein